MALTGSPVTPGCGRWNSPGVTRLLDDAQRATRLLHPNIVPLIDHGVHAERFVYLVEPLLEGQELAQKLGVPCYDAGLVGYPARMRQWDARKAEERRRLLDP